MCLQTPTCSETEAERKTKREGERQSKMGPWELGPSASCSPSLQGCVKQNLFGVGMRSSQEEEHTMALPTMPHLQADSHGQRTISQSATVTERGKRQ